VDLQTAAARLGVHYQTAYRWVRDGSLPAMKRGTTY
jgi:excisionase family DNA binding protein